MNHNEYQRLLSNYNLGAEKAYDELNAFESEYKKDLRRGARYEYRLTLPEKILVFALPAVLTAVYGFWFKNAVGAKLPVIWFAVLSLAVCYIVTGACSLIRARVNMRRGSYEKREKYIALINERRAIEEEYYFYVEKAESVECHLVCGKCIYCSSGYEEKTVVDKQGRETEERRPVDLCAQSGGETKASKKACEYFEDNLPPEMFFAPVE